ncbi:MAG: tetratricopeptide repeat protein [Campylobacterota bacterium]|nr:tetratricopeptide repeat protein [Campylobacterota bacterium]
MPYVKVFVKLFFGILLLSFSCVSSGDVTSKKQFSEIKILASDAKAYNQLGYSVSISADGGRVIAGALRSAYIYTKSGTTWNEMKVTASDGESYNDFGTSVSISADGTTAIVGARYDNTKGSKSGAVYIYEKLGKTWSETKLIASDAMTHNYFGTCVSISGDGTTVIVGANGGDGENKGSGLAYIYTKSGKTWRETKLTASDGKISEYFGYSLSISADGTTAIVGALLDDDYGLKSGSVYIYEKSGKDWIETKLRASDGTTDDWFGHSVSISADGTTVIVGALNDGDKGSKSGSVYIYEKSGKDWFETKLTASDGMAGDKFGYSVSISANGNKVIVGAHDASANALKSGSSYIYTKSEAGWIETKVIASDGARYDNFGNSVSISRDATIAIVGAYNDSDKDLRNGSIYILGLSGKSDSTTTSKSSDIAKEENKQGAEAGKRGDYDKAIKYYKSALEVTLSLLGESHMGTATVYNNIGFQYSNKADYDEAIIYYRKALKIILATKEKESSYLVTVYKNISFAHQQNREYEKAVDYIEKL